MTVLLHRQDFVESWMLHSRGNVQTTEHIQAYPPITSIALINCLNDNLIPYSNCSAIRPLLCDIKWARTRIELD